MEWLSDIGKQQLLKELRKRDEKARRSGNSSQLTLERNVFPLKAKPKVWIQGKLEFSASYMFCMFYDTLALENHD